jgi:TolB-like protein/DNA-binding winged helix-turn-helix (wHTH) protein
MGWPSMLNFRTSFGAVQMSSPPNFPGKIRFGDYELDLATSELRTNGTKYLLQGQPYQILCTLLERPGELVTREELKKKLWSEGTFVDFDHSLNKAVNRLREVLADSAEEPKFIETLPRKGYRFIGAVESIQSPAPEANVAAPPVPSVQEGAISLKLAGRRTGWRICAATLALVILLLATLLIIRQRTAVNATGTAAEIHSLAVLPLENVSGDPSQDYFADGMTDQLITNLGQIGSLRVISRTTIMQYRGVHKALPQIAHELNVDAVVEGTVMRSGGRVRISAQLIQASVDRQLWAQSYEDQVQNVLAVQHEISKAIANQVRMALTPRGHIRAGIDRPLDPEAYESYLRGEYWLNRFTPESIQQATVHFQHAIDKDPDYAPAYAKLSGCYRMLANMGVLPTDAANRKANALVAKALELEPYFLAAHASKGWGLLMHDLDFAASGSEFKLAVDLDPNSPEAHQGLSDYYATIGRVQDAVQEAERTRELDPLASIVNNNLCQKLAFARRYDEVLAQCKANIDLDQNSARSLWIVGDVYAAKGMESEAVSSFLQALRRAGAPPTMIASIVFIDRGGRGYP